MTEREWATAQPDPGRARNPGAHAPVHEEGPLPPAAHVPFAHAALHVEVKAMEKRRRTRSDARRSMKGGECSSAGLATANWLEVV